jgi:hypothetical protein
MDELSKRVFAAIHELPKPVTEQQALETGMALIVNDAPAQQQWAAWMKQNGAQLCHMLNEGA